jgi:hypothetical protein
LEKDQEFANGHSLNFETEFDGAETDFLHSNMLWEAELLDEVGVIVVVDHHFEHNVQHYPKL